MRIRHLTRLAFACVLTIACTAFLGQSIRYTVAHQNHTLSATLGLPEDRVVPDRVEIAGDTYTGTRRRPQAILRNDKGLPIAMLLSLREDREDVSISTAMLLTEDGGRTWRDGGMVLDRLSGTWQGDRAFGTAISRDGDRWVMASCGNDESGATPGIRSVGLWFSDNLVDWEPYEHNPVLTVDDVTALSGQHPEGLVGLYLRDMVQVDGRWLAMTIIRGDHGSWARSVIMEAQHVAGPWHPVSMPLAHQPSKWLGLNDNIVLSQPTRLGDRWYAVTRNGVAAHHHENNRFGIAVSDDYLTWQETGWVSAPMHRSNGSTITAAQTHIVDQETVLVSARGLWGQDKGLYQYPHVIDIDW